MEKVRLGVVGLGNMGSHHIGYLNTVDGAVLAAVCDAEAARTAKYGQENVRQFSHYQQMIDSGTVDALIIATPHFQHGEICRAAFAKNIHILCEKPLAVTIGDARATIAAHAKSPQLKFALVFQQRATHLYSKMRDLVAAGDLGEITRISWFVTDWFRGWSYYASGGWRATWAGEGGGVLLNQCPHNLDLLQWIAGMMPRRITAVAFLGKTHPIETEDEASAILEFDNGAIGHFVTSTGEAPGTNRLEICGDRGKLVAEHGKLTFARMRRGVREIREKDPAVFPTVEAWDIDIPYKSAKPESHAVITQNFVNAILKNDPLISDGDDGVKQVELSNAILMAGITRQAVELPLDAGAYDAFLKEITQKYGGKKKLETREAVVDMSASFSR
ncbi:MAG: Gfo/Idh/MocA family oxidoreductase [Tepidisphaeraceae bacterium]|jgi:predicted dehydrogenase